MRADVLLERMRRSPASGWTMADIERVCLNHDVRCTPPSGGGSHYKLSHAALKDILTIPKARPIKPVYIRKLVRFIEMLGERDAHA